LLVLPSSNGDSNADFYFNCYVTHFYNTAFKMWVNKGISDYLYMEEGGWTFPKNRRQ